MHACSGPRKKLMLTRRTVGGHRYSHNIMKRLMTTKTDPGPSRGFSTAGDSLKKISSKKVALVTLAGCYVGVSLFVRYRRRQKLGEMEPMTSLPPGREDLLDLMERTGQMGKSGARSVKEELDDIRKWHSDHGYKGGLVLRELSKPLFVDSLGTIEGLEGLAVDPMRLARRECYYIYYEITGTGEIKQQIFCRGTTLLVDVLTCLSFWMVYDEELDCRVHLGFRNQADHIIRDIEPLLAPASDKRTTIEVSGHSLGGAVAYIIAAKLRKRGYRVIRTTAIASPRFCATELSSQKIESLLPHDNLRIESEIDIVPFLPPFGHHVGNKLYLAGPDNAYYIPSSDSSLRWLDSTFLNFRFWEILSALGKPHRVPYHITHLKKALVS